MSAGVGENSAVAEFQGLDGAFSFAERLLQRIWLRGDFDRKRAVTSDGRPVRILNPGTWNRLGGPDFLGARLEIGGVLLAGDVELHLRAGDWRAHGHRDDPNYRRVVLHAVLFPPNEPTIGADGMEIPVLALLPLLYRSLEEYAEEEAVERLADHPLTRAHEALIGLTRDAQKTALLECAQLRWQQKVRFAEKRIGRLGWREACHHTALEILGYRFNRGPMLMLASEYPLDRWPAVGVGQSLEEICADYAARWNRQAIRPANQPRTRLKQYAAWCAAVENWPEKLQRVGASIALPQGAEDGTTTHFRKRTELTSLADRLGRTVCGDTIGGTRRFTLLADGFWPLLAAQVTDRSTVFRPYWFHGYCGDLPTSITHLLVALELTKRGVSPLCHGLAQGMLGWVWREEERQQQTTAC